MSFGRFEGRSGSPLFNVGEYLRQSADVATAVTRGEITAWDHFQQFGAAEGRSFTPVFNEAFYLKQNPDVALAVANGEIPSATYHFVVHGQLEPRVVSPVIDLGKYLSANADLDAAAREGSLNPLEHLLEHGMNEGRELGNGLSLADFSNDPKFMQAMSKGDLDAALQRVEAVAPFIPGFVRPADWTPPANTVLPLDFVAPEGSGLQLVIPADITIPPGTALPPNIVPADSHPNAPAEPPVTPPAPNPDDQQPPVTEEPGESSFTGVFKDGVWRFEGYNPKNGPITLAVKPGTDDLFYAHNGEISNVPLHTWDLSRPMTSTRLLISEGQTLELTLEQAALHEYPFYQLIDDRIHVNASGLITREPGVTDGPAGEIIIRGPLHLEEHTDLLGTPRDNTVRISGESKVITLKPGSGGLDDTGALIAYSTLVDGMHIEGDQSTWVNLISIEADLPVSYSTNSRGAMGGTWGDDTLTNTGSTDSVIYGSRGGDTIVLGEGSKSTILLSMGQQQPWVEQTFIVTEIGIQGSDNPALRDVVIMDFKQGRKYEVVLPGEMGTVRSGVLENDLHAYQMAKHLNAQNTVPGVLFDSWSSNDTIVLAVLFDGDENEFAVLRELDGGTETQALNAQASDITKPAFSVSDSTFSNFDTVKGFKPGVDAFSWMLGNVVYPFADLVELGSYADRDTMVSAFDTLEVGQAGVAYVSGDDPGVYLYLDNGNGEVDHNHDALVYLPDLDPASLTQLSLRDFILEGRPMRIDLPVDLFI